MDKSYQVAAIPFRQTETGGIEVLLVTSRETRRWVVPKGWPWPKHADHDAAAGEAWEEAGVRGRAYRKRVGTYTYVKLFGSKGVKVKVRAYLLEVRDMAARWPERRERIRKWFSPAEAASLVVEKELSVILAALDLSEKTASEPAQEPAADVPKPERKRKSAKSKSRVTLKRAAKRIRRITTPGTAKKSKRVRA